MNNHPYMLGLLYNTLIVLSLTSDNGVKGTYFDREEALRFFIRDNN